MVFNCINTPIRYTTPLLQEGESSVIHLLPRTPMIGLNFEEVQKGDLIYRAVYDISVDKNYLNKNLEVKSKLEELEGRIIRQNNIFVYYKYLFIIRDKNVYLLSVVLEGKPFGFHIVKEISEKIGVETVKPCWRGVYTKQVLSAFVEDIFVQRE